MKQFLINAEPTLKKLSHISELNTLLIDHIWVYLDGKNDDEKYIFRDNGEVDLDKSHNQTTAKWTFNANTNKLQIQKQEPLEFTIIYIDKSLVLLERGSQKNEFQYFANMKYLADLKVEQYIRNIVAKEMNLSLVHVTNGFDLEIHRRHAEDQIGTPGQEVSCNLSPLADGFYQSSSSNFIYEIHQSHVVKKKHVHKITLSDGTQASLYSENKTAVVSIGDNVVVNLKPIPDGKYTADESWFIIQNGNVNKAGELKKIKTGQGTLIIEQNESKPIAGDIAYFEGGKPFEGEISIGLFKKIKGSGGKIV